MSLTNFSTESTYIRDLDRILTKEIIKSYEQNELYNKFKVGCKVKDDKLFVLRNLRRIYCEQPCYINNKQYSKIIQKIKSYG